MAKGDQDLDALDRKIKSTDIDWNLMTWLRALPTTQPAVKNYQQHAQWRTTCLSAASSFLFLTLSPVLWLNARRREVGIFAGSGLSKVQISMYHCRIGHDSSPAFLLSYGVAGLLAKESEIRSLKT